MDTIQEVTLSRAVDNREFSQRLYNSLCEHFANESFIVQLAELGVNNAKTIEKSLQKKFKLGEYKNEL